MRLKRLSLYIALVCIVFLSFGCAAPLIVGGAAVTGGTGTFMWINGELATDYHESFEKVWEACEKTVAYMNSADVIPVKEISKGTIDAVIDSQKVRFSVEYKAKELTSVSVRVGFVGDKRSSQLLHDKIADYLQVK